MTKTSAAPDTVQPCFSMFGTRHTNSLARECLTVPALLLLTELKQVLPWLKERDLTALQSALRNLSDAFNAFFKKNASHPVFRKRGQHDSYTSKNNNCSIRVEDKNHIILPKVGRIRVRGLRNIEGRILRATVSRESTGSWYVSLLYETEDVKPLPANNDPIGIDLGLKEFVILSDGTKYDNPRPLSKLENRLAREQRSYHGVKKQMWITMLYVTETAIRYTNVR